MFGLYVHIPFCNKICPYLFDSLYIGGGSPSCLKLELLEKLFLNLSQYVNFLNLKEFTIELNPSDITEEMVILLSKYHISRVSIGVETFSPRLQKLINRILSYDELEKKIHLLHTHHINNINIDLMYALPTETLDDLDEDLKLVIQLKPTHISAYSLILEEHPFIISYIGIVKNILP